MKKLHWAAPSPRQPLSPGVGHTYLRVGVQLVLIMVQRGAGSLQAGVECNALVGSAA